MGDVDHPSRRLGAYVRWYGPLTGITAVLTILAVWAGLWLSAPLALIFTLCAYLWSLDLAEVSEADRDGCRGCAAGCVGCRERIDTPAWPL